MPTTFAGPDQGPALQAVITALLPSWYASSAYDGKAHCHMLAGRTVNIAPKNHDRALLALRGLSDTLAEAADTPTTWRSMSLVETLRAWGWAAEANTVHAQTSHVRLGGIWGDVVFPEHFLALLAVAPYLEASGDAWVFAAGRDDDPAFALDFTGGTLVVIDDVSISYQY